MTAGFDWFTFGLVLTLLLYVLHDVHLTRKVRQFRAERNAARELLREWRTTPFFADKNEWHDWVAEFGRRVDRELPPPPGGGSR